MYNLFKLVILIQSNFIQYGAAHGWHDIWTGQQAGKMDSTLFLPCNESGWVVLNLLSSPWTPTISLEEERAILLFNYTTTGIHIHFFLRVISQASKPDGILAWKQFGLPGQKRRIVKRIETKLCATWTFLICALFRWFAEVSWNLTDSKRSKEQPSKKQGHKNKVVCYSP